MRLLLNAAPVQRGGGLTATTAFVRSLESELFSDLDLHVASRIPIKSPSKVTVHPLPSGRLRAEISLVRLTKLLKPTACISTFGPPPLIKIRDVIYVSNCAYSNLFYPETNFWSASSALDLSRHLVTDFVRLRQTLRADIVTFETLDLSQRARAQHPRSRCEFRYLAPAKDLDLLKQLQQAAPTAENYDSTYFDVLFFSGYHPNKNWAILPAVAKVLASSSLKIRFIFTEDADKEELVEIRNSISLYSEGQVESLCVGKINPDHRSELLRSSDCLVLLSKLESYSNNIYEAWSAAIPLIATDAAWCRSEAREGAIYVTNSDPESIAAAILESSRGSEIARTAVREGTRLLGEMPTHTERAASLFSFIRANGS